MDWYILLPASITWFMGGTISLPPNLQATPLVQLRNAGRSNPVSAGKPGNWPGVWHPVFHTGSFATDWQVSADQKPDCHGRRNRLRYDPWCSPWCGNNDRYICFCIPVGSDPCVNDLTGHRHFPVIPGTLAAEFTNHAFVCTCKHDSRAGSLVYSFMPILTYHNETHSKQ